MKSDYLDTSNPQRLRAFFAFTDVANLAARGIDRFNALLPAGDARTCLIAMLEYQRAAAIDESFNTLTLKTSLFMSLPEI